MIKNSYPPKVSIIIPVYKAESYIHRCIDSILTQTFQDFELLLIDDGSPDKSGSICDNYAQNDNRIRVFHKKNGGVSSARQCGTDNASGEYIIHVDPDDWIEPHMLAELYNKAQEENADMVICDFYVDIKNKTILKKQEPSNLNHMTVLCELFQQLHGSCCNKFVKSTCFNKFNIKFPLQLSYCEDLFVNTCLLLNDIKISYLPKAFYHYVIGINDNSLVSRPTNIILEQGDLLCKLLQEKLPIYLFKQISPYLEYKLSIICLIGGKPYTNFFSKRFATLKSSFKKMKIPYLHKLFLWIAFTVSPVFIHMLYFIRIHIKNKITLNQV